MTLFDTPDREKCTARRTLTNTPLQALVLLNDPTFVEAARVLAARAIAGAGKSADSRIAFEFRLATARTPSQQESRLLSDLFKRQLDHYRRDPKAALALLRVGESTPGDKNRCAELAALTTVASTILNLDETITKQ